MSFFRPSFSTPLLAPPDSRRDLLAIVALGVGVRVALVAMTGTWGAPQLWEYDRIARNLLDGRGFVLANRGDYRAFTTPGWPAILAGLLFIGDYRLVQVVQILLGVLLGVAVYLTVRGVWGRAAALVAGAGTVLHPGLAYYSVVNSDPLPFNALIVFLVAPALLAAARRATPSATVVPGVLIGVTLVTRGTTLLLLPLAAIWLAAVAGLRRAVTATVVMGLVASAFVVPWLIRNAVVLGAPVMTSTAGEMLWWGNNPAASGGVVADDGSNIEDHAPSSLRAVLAASTNELEHNRAFIAEARGFIAGHPAAFVSLWVRKFVQFWWFGPFDGKAYPGWYLAAYKALYTLELLLALAGLVVALRGSRPDAAGLFAAIPLTIAAFQSLFYVQGRHRWMVENFLIVFAAIALAAIAEWVRPRVVPHGA